MDKKAFFIRLKSKIWQARLYLTDMHRKALPFKNFFQKKMPETKDFNVKTFGSRMAEKIKNSISGIKPLFKEFPTDLTVWTLSGSAGKCRAVLLILSLCVIFWAASVLFYFQANDAFISFRYASNAMKGWGFVWNPPPFMPVDGYTSYLWTVILYGMWRFADISPLSSADILTYLFSMGSVGLCFAFLRRMTLPENIRQKGIWIFFAVCFILLTNRTFLAFMSSGTEAALFNFLALWWTYEASSRTRNPFWLSCSAVLLALTRLEGIVFVAATVVLLVLFIIRKQGLWKNLFAFLPLAALKFYFDWRIAFYGEIRSNLYLALFDDFFPAFGWDYLLSFIVEYGLYFWTFFFLVWFTFKCLTKRFQDLIVPSLLILTFVCYTAYYVIFTGGDILEFRPFGIFIPLCTIGGIGMITSNISRNFKFLMGALGVYLVCALPIPWTHYFLTHHLETRKETTFLYRPVSSKIGFLGFPVRFWDEAQKRLIYQGVGLRHQEHKILTRELLASFPLREVGERITTHHRRIFAWDFVGVAGWVLPETYIIDTSGQNDWIVARAYLRDSKRRLVGHERFVPPGYVNCFNGGTNLRITPFDGTQDAAFLPSAYLNDSEIKGCENFWRSQAKLRQYKEIELKER